jgi:hypothetical protein
MTRIIRRKSRMNQTEASRMSHDIKCLLPLERSAGSRANERSGLYQAPDCTRWGPMLLLIVGPYTFGACAVLAKWFHPAVGELRDCLLESCWVSVMHRGRHVQHISHVSHILSKSFTDFELWSILRHHQSLSTLHSLQPPVMVGSPTLHALTSTDHKQAPKTTVNVQKQATILAWFHKTALAYSLKDLEKLIPSIASINGMVVKDYVQALTDDSLIQTEKIGSGNWYWSFPSEAKKKKEKSLAEAQEAYNKASAAVSELQAKVDQAGAAQAEDVGLLAETGAPNTSPKDAPLIVAGGDRKALVTKHEELTTEVETLRIELAAYSEFDPVELHKKIEHTRHSRAAADKFTEHIYCMESWLKERIPDRESQVGVLRELYGDEWDEEEEGLREL